MGLAVGGVILWSFAVPDAPDFQRPELARIFFFHFPCPIMATVLLPLGAYFGFRFLRSGDLKWDVRSAAANELGYLFCLLTMATGILFSYVQWGTWWQWDPRQSSFLLVLTVYAAYFALRGAHSDEQRRATMGAGYALAAVLPFFFLVYAFPRLEFVRRVSFHPTDSIMGGQIKGQYAMVIVAMLVVVTFLSVWLYRMRVKAGMLELAAKDMYGSMEADSGAAAPTGVVRPVSLPSEN